MDGRGDKKANFCLNNLLFLLFPCEKMFRHFLIFLLLVGVTVSQLETGSETQLSKRSYYNPRAL